MLENQTFFTSFLKHISQQSEKNYPFCQLSFLYVKIIYIKFTEIQKT